MNQKPNSLWKNTSHSLPPKNTHEKKKCSHDGFISNDKASESYDFTSTFLTFLLSLMLYSGVQKEEAAHRCWIPSTVSSLSFRSSGFRSSASSNKLPSNSTHAGTSPLDLHIHIHTVHVHAERHGQDRSLTILVKVL